MEPTIVIPDSHRFRYRLMSSLDAPLFFELDQDPEVMRYLNGGTPTPWKEIVDHFVPRIAKFTDPIKGTGLWEVVDKGNEDFLGWILVREYGFDTDYHETNNFELGWRFKRPCWGQGVASEAARAVMNVLQNNTTIARFSALADPDNLGSIAVMKKLGMRFVDTRIHRLPEEDVTVVYYSKASE